MGGDRDVKRRKNAGLWGKAALLCAIAALLAIMLGAGMGATAAESEPASSESIALAEGGAGDAADYMIITSEPLVGAVEPLQDYKESQGLSVQVTTTQWIEENYSGPDTVEKIRVFLQENYASLGIDYVLLAGTISTIPMRSAYVEVIDQYNNSVLYIPTDYYYSDLSGDWDLNDDGKYGEAGVDDLDGGVDFWPEVYVGRIPTDDAVEMTAICQKIVDYSNDSGTWKHDALLLGSVFNYFMEQKEVLATYGSVPLERMRTNLLDPLGYTSTTMYEKEGLAPETTPCDAPLNHENVLAAWSGGKGIVSISARGKSGNVSRQIWISDDGDGIPEWNEMLSPEFLTSSDAAVLDDDHPSIVFTTSSNAAYPESQDSLLNTLMKNGACAAVGATSQTWYTPGWQDEYWGGSNTVGYMFWKYLLQDGCRIGKALRMADVWYNDNCGWLAGYTRCNLYAFNLYGDPSMKLDAEGSPTVTAITPASAWNMGPLDVTVTGFNFLEGAQLMLRKEGQEDIETVNLSVESSTLISATIDIAAAPVGTWNVVVRNPDGQEAVLAEGFEVTSPCGPGGGTAVFMLGITLGILSLAGSGRIRRRLRKGLR